jgi:Pyruvate/2-oxoacid:ferredoxin oxidoreductase delta subunit
MMVNEQIYELLAERLDALPNGFPATDSGVEQRLLAKLFSPDEAWLAAQLRLGKETPERLAQRIGGEPEQLAAQLKGMARHGLIAAGRTDDGLGFGLLPFVVGIYEMQASRLDAEMARLFEDYYLEAFGRTLAIEPSVHRIIPVNESVRMDIEIQPFESASDIIANANAWGVVECICRKQKALIGEPCDHPLEVCMMLSKKPGAFDNNPAVRSLTHEGAMATLKQAADAGLVHSVSNSQDGLWYICNCCTCSCGILRGLADLGIANAVARSAYVNHVDEELCIGCELCIDYCQFDALTMADEFFAQVDEMRCLGCGVCVQSCIENALALVRRPPEEIKSIPVGEVDWGMQRAKSRGLNLERIL